MTINNSLKNIITGMGAAAVLAGGSLSAGDLGKAVVNDKMPIAAPDFCDIFKKNTLYEGDGFIKKVKLKGRYQAQWISQSEDDTLNATGVETTNGYHEFQHRRFRLGTEISMANDLKLVASMNITDGSGGAGQHGLTRSVFFDDWDELYIEWAPSKTNYVIVGKSKQKITIENETSSNSILTIERSAISSSVISSKPWGVAVGFEGLGIKHEVGAWISGASRDQDTAWLPGAPLGDRWDYADFDSRGSATYRATADITEQIEGHFDYQFTNNSKDRKSVV